ncbi:hypothetical protein ACVME5_009233 [Bradyrhizobium liaoningense]
MRRAIELRLELPPDRCGVDVLPPALFERRRIGTGRSRVQQRQLALRRCQQRAHGTLDRRVARLIEQPLEMDDILLAYELLHPVSTTSCTAATPHRS